MTDAEKLAKAVELLKQCDEGFSAFIMGRRMRRKERDALREKIQEFLGDVLPPPAPVDVVKMIGDK